MAAIRNVSSYQVTPLTSGFVALATEPDRFQAPAELDAKNLSFHNAVVPGCAASIAGLLPSDANPDTFDIWYRTSFTATPDEFDQSCLRLLGLATLADVWLNDVHILSSDNMFIEHELDISGLLQKTNALAIRFRALEAELKRRKGRPRYRTRLVNNQKLCQFRTSLLGRIPGWTKPLPPVGPWKPILLEQRSALSVEEPPFVRCTLDGTTGIVSLRLRVREQGSRLHHAELVVAEHRAPCAIERNSDSSLTLVAELSIKSAKRWWPHTHGEPVRYPAHVILTLSDLRVDVELSELAFRTLAVATDDNSFELRVNGVPVFCRGASWTTLSALDLCARPEDYMTAIEQVQRANMNMLRLSGTMFYEHDAFYDACDARGILVWQDFMFANMDYPSHDPAFMKSVELEARQLLARLQARPSLAVLCGGSEVYQQAAMLGLSRGAWENPLFEQLLPSLAREYLGEVPYVPSTPYGGTLPFRANAGVAHYFGVGAYLRPLEDARRANVRFAAECLAFSNVPEPETVDALLADGQAPFHDPIWKAAVPRDSGSGWDFEDVRDHYLRTLFGVDPLSIRYADSERYLELGRIATGEVIAQTFSEWRRKGSSCKGALIWFLRDLYPGAGFGLIDAMGRAKSVYFYLRRVLAPRAVFLTDEGLNGLGIHIQNDSPERLVGKLELNIYRTFRTRVAEAALAVEVPAHSGVALNSDQLLNEFLDVTYAYRFGPPPGELVVATLRANDGSKISEAFQFPLGHPANQDHDVELKAQAEPAPNGFVLTLSSERFAQAVALRAPGFVPDDNYFHLAPRASHCVRFSKIPGESAPKSPQIAIKPLNSSSYLRIALAAHSRSEP